MRNFTYQNEQTLPLLHWWPFRTIKRQPNAPRRELEQTQLAFHRAYRRFARTHPTWVSRRFDADFLRRALMAQLTHGQQAGAWADCLPTGVTLALAWDHEFGPLTSGAGRAQQLAELTRAATHFLHMFEQAFRQLAVESIEKQKAI